MHPLVGYNDPNAVAFAYQPGRNSWEAISNGVTLRIAMDPATPRVGEPVRFHVEASYGNAKCCGLFLMHADGGRDSQGGSSTPEECAIEQPGPGSADFTHVYNQPGTWEFSFQASTRCENIRYSDLHGYVDVAPGMSRSQGPELPKAFISEARAPSDPIDRSTVKVWAKGTDEDGYITRIVIDFGDGTPAVTRAGEPNACRLTPSGWPAASWAFTVEPFPTHHYSAPGTYTVSATIVSAGCDGSEEQTSTATMAYSW